MDMKRLQGETVFNTTFYDELLDSSLDDKGVDMVISLLAERKKKYNEGSYIITHRQQSVLNNIDKIINLEKRNGATYLLNT
jgi:ABC-type Mn2+/Zn2+ transport system ATPase subunit